MVSFLIHIHIHNKDNHIHIHIHNKVFLKQHLQSWLLCLKLQRYLKQLLLKYCQIFLLILVLVVLLPCAIYQCFLFHVHTPFISSIISQYPESCNEKTRAAATRKCSALILISQPFTLCMALSGQGLPVTSLFFSFKRLQY